MLYTRSLLLLISFGLSACAIVSRHSGSGYSPNSRIEDEDSVYDYSSTRELTPEERESLEERMLLSRLEKTLLTNEERAQYQRYKNALDTDRERIEFLSLDGFAARERYLQSRGTSSSPSRFNRDIASLIEQSDIALGMSPQAVRESWGDPMAVEVSGRPGAGNERWLYKEFVVTQEGYQQEQRLLYFENGKLVGWEKY